MFLHNLKYEFLNNIRQKESLFWLMCFPIILGTFFYMGFGKLYEKEEMFSEIPVAVTFAKEDAVFESVIGEMKNADDSLFEFRYADTDKAEKMLKQGDVFGIITVDDEISLTVISSGIEQSIIKSFLDQYKSQRQIISDISAVDPAGLTEAVKALHTETDTIKNNSPTNGNMNYYDMYFMNLITMAALFGMITGLYSAINNQGNLSAVGARKCLSPNIGFITIASSLLAGCITQLCSVILTTSFVLFILKIDLGGNILMIYLTGALGAFAGVSIGFFIGSAGRMSEAVKGAISTSVSLFCCFLSGLMVGNMKTIIEEKCPVINSINPAAIISDMLYYLTIEAGYTRYIEKAAALLIISLVFITGGFLMTRRKTYENL